MKRYTTAERMLDTILAHQPSRQKGQTTAIANLCRETDGIFLAANYQQAKQVRDQFNVATLTLIEPDRMRGLSRPLFLDHFAWQTLALELRSEIEQTRIALEIMTNEAKTLRGERNLARLEVQTEKERYEKIIGSIYGYSLRQKSKTVLTKYIKDLCTRMGIRKS